MKVKFLSEWVSLRTKLADAQSERSDLAEKYGDACKQRDEWRDKYEQLRKPSEKLIEEHAALKREIDDVRSKLRNQTEAELALVSVKILLACVNGERPKDEEVARQLGLQNQLSQMNLAQSNARFGYPSLGIFGGIGGGL